MVRFLATGFIIPPRSGYDARLPRRAVGGHKKHGGRETAPAQSRTEAEGRRHSRSVSQSQAGLGRARVRLSMLASPAWQSFLGREFLQHVSELLVELTRFLQHWVMADGFDEDGVVVGVLLVD